VSVAEPERAASAKVRGCIGGLAGAAGQSQSRYLEAAVNGLLVASIYAPNGNPQPGRPTSRPRFVEFRFVGASKLSQPTITAGLLVRVETQQEVSEAEDGARALAVAPADSLW
jgi:hypothetical protein